jgi:hypothetical protein
MSFNAFFPLLSNSGFRVFTLEDLFKQLSYGELSTLAVALDASGAIKKERQNQIVHFANEALRKLHARLPLKEADLTVTLTGEEITHEFDANTLLVMGIISSFGEPLTFETTRIPQRITVTGDPLTIRFPKELTGEVQVIYRNRHPLLNSVTTGEDLTQEIELLPELEPALTSYIASKVFGGMSSQDSMALANNYRMQYEQTIADVLNAGLLPGDVFVNHKLETRGFV